MKQNLPVLLHHHVTARRDSIAVSPENFETQLKALSAAGFRGVSLAEAHAFLVRGERLPGRPCLITFDDGYLDNATNAWPLLTHYGHKAVVFAVTSRLENGPVRPTLGDARAGRAALDELPNVTDHRVDGEHGLWERRDPFLSWDEARAMEASGVIRVEPHGHRHASVFCRPDFQTFFKPRNKKRTFDDIETRTVFGLPRFEEGPSLSSRAFLPADELYDLALRETPQETGEALRFFADSRNEERLRAKVLAIPRERWGRFETDAEYTARVHEELAPSIAAIRENLGRSPVSLAWPWGAYTETARETARGLGIEMFFCTTPGANPPGSAAHVNRFKVRDKGGAWLRSRLEIYSRTWLARAYAMIRR